MQMTMHDNAAYML